MTGTSQSGRTGGRFINLSMNELSSLLKRSIEAFGYCQGDCEDAAAAVVWLESRGIGGLDAFVSSCLTQDEYGGEPLRPFAGKTNVQVIDACDRSVFFCGRTAVDLACALATVEKAGRIEIKNCRDRKAILASLQICAAREINAVVQWCDDESVHIALLNARQPGLDYRQIRRTVDHEPSMSSLNVVCSKSRQMIDTAAADLAGGDVETALVAKISSTDMQAHYATAVKHGLRVDPNIVRTLTVAADAVLVEATEQSRLGAGE